MSDEKSEGFGALRSFGDEELWHELNRRWGEEGILKQLGVGSILGADTKVAAARIAESLAHALEHGNHPLPVPAIVRMAALLSTPDLLELLKGREISSALFKLPATVQEADLEATRRERDDLLQNLHRRRNEIQALTADRSRLRAQMDALRAEARAVGESWNHKVDKALAVLMGRDDAAPGR